MGRKRIASLLSQLQVCNETSQALDIRLAQAVQLGNQLAQDITAMERRLLIQDSLPALGTVTEETPEMQALVAQYRQDRDAGLDTKALRRRIGMDKVSGIDALDRMEK